MKSGLRFGAVLGAMLSLAACGGAAPANSPAPASSAAAAASSAAAKPAGSAGATSAKPAAEAGASGAAASTQPIKIGALLPLTGVAADTGKNHNDGFSLYLDSIGNTVGGRKIEMVNVDTQGKPDVALAKAKELVENEHVQMLVGFIYTPECTAVSPYAAQAQVPMVITSNCGSESLLTDPKLKNAYTVRLTQTATSINDPAADWAYKQGYRRAMMLASDYSGGIETSDTFASAFVSRGGSITAEVYPPLGTSDFGPYLAQLSQHANDADVLFVFLTGIDGLRFLQQSGSYLQNKLPILDPFGSLTTGNNIQQGGDAAIGLVSAGYYTTAFDSPENRSFIKAFSDKYNKPPTVEVAQAYAGAQVIAQALKTVNGNIEQRQGFLNALYAVDAATAKGPVKLDSDHDVVMNVYVSQTVKNGSAVGEKLLATYNNVARTWDRTQAEIDAFPFGTLKGKWVGMTKDKLAQVHKA